jgi:hypothetical protein
MERLHDVMPSVQLLSTFHQYFDLWSYVSEQEWVGERGLNRFHQQYENMTQVLLNSETYEMSLLDSMAECVKVVSVCSSFSESSDLYSLLALILSEVIGESTGRAAALLRKIRTVCSKVTEIKDWFANGFDEIASARAIYETACKTGFYSLASIDESSPPILSLEIGCDPTSKLPQTLSSSGLQDMIQHLSLIHEEDSNVNKSLRTFISQCQTLRKVEQNVAHMFEMGYGILEFASFSCSASPRFSEESDELLAQSQKHHETFRHWIASTRRMYPTALLFTVEELREVYFGIVKKDPTDSAHLEAMLGRIPQRDGFSLSDMSARANSQSWYLFASEFVERASVPSLPAPQALGSIQPRRIMIHSLTSQDGNAAFAVLSVLNSIYKVSVRCRSS